MRGRTVTLTTGLKSFVVAFGLLTATFIQAQAQPKPAPAANAPAAPLPILRLDAEGPLSTITALAFSNDGSTLYAAGWDKAIYAWTLDENGTYQFTPEKILRIPIGPQHSVGLINSLAMSSDGQYLAAAGVAKGSHNAGFSEGGLMWPASAVSSKHLKETGTIYVFDLKAPNQPSITHLRGHLGTVTDLTFPTHKSGQAPVLVSAGEEKNPNNGKKWGTVRVWNLNQPGQPIASKFDLPAPSDAPTMPRSIGAVRTGNGPKSLHVGIAWGDAFLRFWDVAQNNFVKVPNNASVACVGVGDQFLVAGGNREKQWRLTAWSPPVKVNDNPKPEEHTFLNNTWSAPIGLATASEANLALVVSAMLPPSPNGTKIGFFLADSRTLKRTPANAQTTEFGNMGLPPAYALSANGKVVAVAGNQDRKIQVYRVNANGNAAIAQTLESQGELFPRVRFFAKGNSLGLGLNSDNQKAAPDLLFDMTASQVADPAGWNPAPSEAKAKFTATKGKQKDRDTVVTKFPDNTGTTIVLPEKHEIKQIAVCPQTENHNPLVGVVTGSRSFAESILRIFDAKTGQCLRQFSGHTDNITSLAFSDNGKLMASAGLDRTVRVWWMEDLKDHVNQSGFLNALKVQDLNDVATVEKIDTEVAADDVKDQLKPGDVIDGFTTPAKKFIETPTAEHFYYYLSSVTPGQTVELKVRRNGQVLNPAPKVKMQQAIDERKPLFTLFFNQPGNAQKVSWIGWAPMGHFDSSDPEIEQLVGWHFNPVQADSPSTYSQLSEYRKDHFFQKGFLKNMIENGQPTAAVVIPEEIEDPVVQVPEPAPLIVEAPVAPVQQPDPPKPAPNPALAERGRTKPQLFLFVKEQTQPDNGEAVYELLEKNDKRQLKAKSKNLKAILTVKDAPMPLSEVKSRLVWELGGKPQKLEVNEARSGDFEVDLSTFDWKRQENDEPYVLYVSFTGGESETKYFSEQWIVYDPPKPDVKPMPMPPPPKKVLPHPSIIAPDSLTVLYDQESQKQIPVRVELSPAADGDVQDGQLIFEIKTEPNAPYKPLLQNGQPLTKPFDEDTAKIEALLPLQNGLNQIRVQLKSNAGKETKVSNEVVIYFRRPPRVDNLQVKAEKENPRALVTCAVQTPADLPIREWRVLVNRKMYIVPQNQVVSQPKANAKNVADITLKNVLLEEGKNTVRVIPRNADGRVLSTPKAEVVWEKYEPPQGPLPSRPKIYFKNVNDQVPLAGYWPGDEFTVAFNVLAEADLQWVKVYYNGKHIATPQVPQPENGMKYKFTLPVKLAKDVNNFQVVALDKNLLWNEAEVPLSPLKPPVTLVIDQVDVPGDKAPMKPKNPRDQVVEFAQAAGAPNAILRGRVMTSDSMKFGRPFVHCWVNGYLQWTRANPIPGKPTEWQFAMNVVLNQPDNTIRLELPEAPKSPFSQSECHIRCAQPNTEQKLHLVVVGLDPKAPAKFDTNKLKKQAAKAFGVNAKNGPFKDPEIHVIPRGDVRVAAITQQLMSIKASKKNPEKGEHDLVVFFYQGGEMQKDDQSVFLTFDGGPAQNLLTDQKLKSLLGDISGAHLLLLDVAQMNKPKDKPNTGKEPYPLGILRTVHEQGMPQGQEFPLMSVLDKVLPNIKELDKLPNAVNAKFQAQPQKPAIQHHVPQVMKHTIVGTKQAGAKVVGAKK